MFRVDKMDMLIAVYIFCIAASELMGGKTFHLVNLGFYNLNASVAIFLFPLIFTINDIVAEVYGKEKAISIARSGLVVVTLIFLFSILFTALPPSQRFIPSEGSYDKIFGLSARIAAASLIAFTFAQIVDILIFTKLREKLHKKALWLRNNLSNFGSQLIDTSLFMVLAFYAFDKSFDSNFAFLLSLIIPYWLLKCFMSLVETPLVYLGVKWLKKGN